MKWLEFELKDRETKAAVVIIPQTQQKKFPAVQLADHSGNTSMRGSQQRL
jgi:hypothetical protein